MGGEWVEGIVTYARSECHFIKVHGKLVQHPSNNLSIPTHYIYISIQIYVTYYKRRKGWDIGL